MKSILKDWIAGTLLVLILMALVSWSIYTGYNQLLQEQWRQEAALRTRHLTGDLEDVYARLEVLARCEQDQLLELSSPQWDDLENAGILDQDILKDLDVSEITLREMGSDQIKILYNPAGVAPANIWRGSLYDLAKSGQMQSVMEVTEFGPRLSVQLPFDRKGKTWVLEVSTKLNKLLTRFSHREGCQVALLIPQLRWEWGQGKLIKNADGDTYIIAAATIPNADKLLSMGSVQKFLGHKAYGVFGDQKNDETFGMLFMAGVEYQSSKAPVAGARPSLVLWNDYGAVIERLNRSRKGSLTVLWLIGGVFGGIVGYILWKLRCRSQREFAELSAQDRRLIITLQSQLAALRKNESALQSASKSLVESCQQDHKLVGRLAHQLKVSASGIVGYTSVSQSGSGLDKNEAYEEILESAHQIFTQAENIDLWMRRKEFEKSVCLRAVDLSVAVEQALTPLADWMRHKDISLQQRRAPGLKLKANEVLLVAVLRNLLSNAVKYAPRASSISLETRSVSGRVEISISNAGNGLNPLQMEKVFEMPEDLRSRGSAGEEGLGLGLRLSYWACETMGAQLNIFSGADDGCRAVIVLGVA